MTDNTRTKSSSAADGATNDHILRVVFFVEAFAIILANLLTIITFTINRHLRKRSMYCLINLAVADMFFGIAVIFKLTFTWKTKGMITFVLKHNLNYASWTDVIHGFVIAATMCCMVLVAVERMCATVWPLRHRNAGSRVYAVVISIPWVAAVISGVLSAITIAMDNSAHHTTLSKIQGNLRGPVMFLLVGVMCVSYLIIFIKVKQHQHQHQHHRTGQRIPRLELRLLKTLFIVTVVSIGTWIPLAVVSMLTAKGIIIASYEVLGGAILLATCNSLINPVIYVLRMEGFRKSLLQLILTCSRYRPTRVVPQPNQRQEGLVQLNVMRRTVPPFSYPDPSQLSQELSQVDNQTINQLH